MALPDSLRDFCNAWRAKARDYSVEEIRGAFDRFFTSYVVFNRLYAEATYRLARRGQVKLRERFPDSQAAQEYVLQYCGAEFLMGAWEGDEASRAALHRIVEHLRERRFALKLDPLTGARRPDEDRKLLEALESKGKNRRAKAVLEALYAIRCNMFHGQKGFQQIQLELLQPAIAVLEKTADALYRALEQNAE
jgi:hypothetical protein